MLSYVNVLFVADVMLIPEPSAPASVVFPFAITTSLSETTKSVVLIVVVVPVTVRLPFIVTVLPLIFVPIITFVVALFPDPMLIAVVPAPPPVPILIVFVLDVAIAPVLIFVVFVAVLEYPKVKDVDEAKAAKVALPSIDVVNVGLARYATVPPAEPNVIVVESVPLNVKEFCTANVFPAVMVIVAADAGAVNVMLLIVLLKVAAPLKYEVPEATYSP